MTQLERKSKFTLEEYADLGNVLFPAMIGFIGAMIGFDLFENAVTVAKIGLISFCLWTFLWIATYSRLKVEKNPRPGIVLWVLMLASFGTTFVTIFLSIASLK